MLRLHRLALRLRTSRLRTPSLLNGLLNGRTGRDIARGLNRTLPGHSLTGLLGLGLLKLRGLLRAR